MDYTAYQYEFQKFREQLTVTQEFASNTYMGSEYVKGKAFDDVIAYLYTWEFATRKLTEYRWPVDWKQAFKERWFPKWLLARYPVKYKTITLNELMNLKRNPASGYIFRFAVLEDDIATKWPPEYRPHP